MRAALLIVLFSPVLGWAQGPIETRNARAASLAFLRLGPRGDLLRKGENSAGLSFLSANALLFERSGVREDAETERLAFTYRRGFARGEWGIEVPLLVRGGGFQDPLIEAYHELIGIHNFRGTIPFGRVEERLPGSGSFGSASGLGDVSGVLSRALGPQAFLSVGLKLPTGDAGGLLGSGGVDLAASLYERWKIGRHFDLHGQFGGVLQGRATRLDRARSFVRQASLSLVYRQNSRDAYAFQWQDEASALRVGDRSRGAQRQLTLGYSRRLGSKDALQVYFNEDGDFLNYKVPALVNVAPDFTFGINLVRRF